MQRSCVAALVVASLLVVQVCALLPTPTPPMGWNTWCTDDVCGLIDLCTEKEVLSIAQAMKSNGMLAAGYNIIELDDCWASTSRSASGELQWDAKQFPSGMPAVISQLHDMGFRFGIYLCSGTLTCKRQRPGSWGYYDVDTKTMAKWGVDLIKLDFCHHPGGFTPQQLYSNFSSWMDHSGRQMMFSTCEWGEGQPWLTFGDFANMIRVTHDHLPLFDYDGQGGKNGIGTKQVIEEFGAGNLGTYSKHGAFMDADLLETLFPTITYEESVTEFSLWALVSSPMIVATDVRKMSDEKKGILLNTEVIAVSQDPIAVGGKRIVNNTDGGQVWIKNLADGSVAIVLYNSNSKWGSRSVKITVEWAQIPGVQWSNSDLVLVRDLWAHEDVGKMSNGLTFEVDPKSVRMFRCTK